MVVEGRFRRCVGLIMPLLDLVCIGWVVRVGSTCGGEGEGEGM